MTDISVVQLPLGTAEKRSWFLGPHGAEPGTTPSVTLDVSKFDAATHYPNGFIPSGTAIARVTASKLWGPADTAATDGRQTWTDDTVGILFNSVTVVGVAGTKTKVGSARLVHGFVNKAKLPFASGAGAVTSAVQTALRLIHFTAGE